jgi:hypothetical protein
MRLAKAGDPELCAEGIHLGCKLGRRG